MTVTVVMPAFNEAQRISGALSSIHAQSRCVDQVVVVDDGSTDATVDAVRSWCSRLPITIVQHARNSGISAALRTGVDAATSDWVLRLDADDRWEPDHVRLMLEAIADKPDSVLVTASAWLVNEAGERGADAHQSEG